MPELLSLMKAADPLIGECRMVLSGVQALFGFQLVAVFSDRVDKPLGAFEKLLHLGSIALVAVAIARIMTPAPYQRMTAPACVTAHFIRLSTRLLMARMAVLMVALAIDADRVERLVDGRRLATPLAGGPLAIFALLWFGLPCASRLPRRDAVLPADERQRM